ncbi:MAG TPA: TatD family hydrolase [Candidatus Cloacimonadota bacterium]|jgi:TatD DNase family protein|nr:TatD family hydrolase [Candidatus Cloacimonadales bacterium]HOQ79606.1 TatD family hydrolase [Candidatus Cloacimonadota bacterium]HPK41288.1 TatD family hydrolase [Candidatus Cloacimonadota bacterium]HPY96211.1 TatD family hydrolase [Candidatus Cloacimonadota bacterium]HQB40795.1 TatD family hydrolase [Candidatus Cloacimonadota bacterium]
MNIFETHAHLDFDDYKHDREQMIQKAFKVGVKNIINIGIDEKSSRDSIKLAEQYPEIYASVGYHPSTVKIFNEKVVYELAKHKKVVAIGEIGLDYYRNYNPKDMQKKAFARQVEIACEIDKPIIIHDREAHEDCFDVLKQNKAKKVVFHCFSGDVAFAEKVLAEDWYISITGVITYKNNDLADVVRILPKDKFFIETDSPYLTPVPHRGKRNTPEYLTYVVQKISDILRIPPNLVAEQTYQNAKRFFLQEAF